MSIEFRKITGFPRGTLCGMLADAYAFDPRWAAFFCLPAAPPENVP